MMPKNIAPTVTVSVLIKNHHQTDLDRVISRDLDCLPLDFDMTKESFWINVISYPDEPIQ